MVPGHPKVLSLAGDEAQNDLLSVHLLFQAEALVEVIVVYELLALSKWSILPWVGRLLLLPKRRRH